MSLTLLETAKDATGREVKAGDVCIYLGRSDQRDPDYRGRRVIIRAIKAPQPDPFFGNVFTRGPKKGQFKPGWPNTTVQLRIDDDIDHDDAADKWRWSAWVNENEISLAK
jgi:hypothetical protein